MLKRLLLFFVMFAFVSRTLAQLDTNDIEIIGVVRSGQLCLLSNTEHRPPSYYLCERQIVIEKNVIDEFNQLNDSLILNLLLNKGAYVYFGNCYLILNDVLHKFRKEDPLYELIQRSHPIRFFEFEEGHYFSVIEKRVDYVKHYPVKVNEKYYYQYFNTDYFLLVSLPYRICSNKLPLMSYGDEIMRDFWLDPESSQDVVVIIPLICDND